MAFFSRSREPAGARPGTLAVHATSPPPLLTVHRYDAAGHDEARVEDVEGLRACATPERPTWVDVCGLGDVTMLARIGEIFGIHPLALEAAVNVPQRARSDVFANHHVLVARIPLPDASGGVAVPQVAILIGEGYLLTFRERDFGVFEPVEQRLREGIGPIRTSGVDYLAYALLDAAVDAFFPVAEALSHQLDELEEEVLDVGDPACLARIHANRRAIVMLRRVIRPQREAIRTLMSQESPFVGAEVRTYLRDTYDHMAQIAELLDAGHEMSMGLVDLLLSTLSHKTNEVMRVLTLMASLFIPLTFLAGVYGMNFEYMPELHTRWAYPGVLGTMGLLAFGMIAYFRHRGWLGRRRRAS